jgi:hypothetical protein
MTALESFINAAIGFVVSWAATWYILGYTMSQSVGVTGLFFVLSFTRNYVVRSIFRRING